MGKGAIILSAGGTGGHLFPAEALAHELIARGWTIHLMTDERVRDYGKSFPAAETHIVPSATLSLSKPWLVPGRAMRLYGGYRAALEPRKVYECLPDLPATRPEFPDLETYATTHSIAAYTGRASTDQRAEGRRSVRQVLRRKPGCSALMALLSRSAE